MEEKKKNWKSVLGWVVLISCSILIGFYGPEFIMERMPDLTFWDFILSVIVFILSFPLHIVLHEIGHLIGGYLSGYQFIMFRLFNTVWIQTEQGLSKRKQYIQGILGQALMMPPENVEEPPFLLYHASGVLMNLITALLMIFLGAASDSSSVSILLYVSAFVAVLLLIMNVVPVKGNDGYNIIQHYKRPETLKEMTDILYLYSGMVKGVPFSDLQKYIDIENLDGIENPNTVTFMTARAAAFYEQNDYLGARQIYAELWKNRSKLIEPHKPEVYHNYLYTLLLTDPQHVDVENVRGTNVYKNYERIKTADGLKVRAAEALFLEGKPEKAKALLNEGEPMIALAPTLTEEKSERQLYAYLKGEIKRCEGE